jgi:hypothetical protein
VLLEDFGEAPAWTDFDLAFTLPDGVPDIEYRIEYFGNADLDVDTVQLRAEALPWPPREPGPAATFPP